MTNPHPRWLHQLPCVPRRHPPVCCCRPSRHPAGHGSAAGGSSHGDANGGCCREQQPAASGPGACRRPAGHRAAVGNRALGWGLGPRRPAGQAVQCGGGGAGGSLQAGQGAGSRVLLLWLPWAAGSIQKAAGQVPSNSGTLASTTALPGCCFLSRPARQPHSARQPASLSPPT